MSPGLSPAPPGAPTAAHQQLKRQLRQTLEDDRSLLMTAQPFTAMLAMQLNLVPVVDSRLPVAGTDGHNVFFNALHMTTRSAEDRRFILAHEVWHCALGHLRRQLGREQTRWNQAIDYEVNHLLFEELHHRPADALYSCPLKRLSAEEIYTRLQAVRPQQEAPAFDTHDLASLLQGADGGALIDPDFAPQLPCSSADAQALSESWQLRLVATAQQRERLAGELPGHLRRLLDEIRTPTLPWRQLLARFVQKLPGAGARQWLPPSRRHVHRGLYLPSLRSSRLELTLALDNSGSCTPWIGDFLGEVRGILASVEEVSLRLLVFDTRITTDLQLDHHSLHTLETLSIEGGGGTSLKPVFEACKEQPPQALIILTDGYAEAPAEPPPFPVLWVLPREGRCPVRWGEQLRISS